MRRAATVALLSVVLASVGGATASAVGVLIEGRHNVLRAGMYATLLNEYPDRRFQVLDQLCPKPNDVAECEQISNSLRRAIDDAVTVPFTWVHRERRDGGLFWTLSPVVRDGASASFLWGAEKPGSNCRGHGELRFQRIDWTGWTPDGGTGHSTCSARG
jgi:hypothetical protein